MNKNQTKEADRKKQELISKIEFPVLEHMVNEYMTSHGYAFNLYTDYRNRNILEVQVVGRFWMSSTVHIKDLEDKLAIIPLIRQRPESITHSGRGFQMIRK